MKFLKKAAILLLAFSIVFLNRSFPALATDAETTVDTADTDTAAGTNEEATEGMTPEEIEIQKLKDERLNIPVDSNKLKNWPEGPTTTGKAAIVMDVNSGAVLYEKNADAKLYPASITKIMTALVALENGKLTDKVTFTEDSVSFLEWGDASIGMRPGEELTLEQALYGMMLASANEVSHAIAESIGGFGYEGFIEKMNEKAKELGCTGTHFVNANGLHDDDHYITARDMAIISSAAYQYEEFRKIINTPQYEIPETNLVKEKRVFQQNHKMIFEWEPYYYEYSKSGKTGFTDQSGTTLVSYADDGNMELVTVVLDTFGGIAYTDTRALFDYAFGNFSYVPIQDKINTEDIEKIPAEAHVVLPDSVSFKNLKSQIKMEKKGENKANLLYTYDAQPVGSTEVTVSKEYLKKSTAKMKADTKEAKKEKKASPWKWILAAGIICAVAIMAFVIAVRIRKRRERELRRRRRQRRLQEQRRERGEEMHPRRRR